MRCSNRVPSQLPEVLQKPAGPPGGEARLGSPSDPGQASLHLLLTMLSPDFTFKQLSEYYLQPFVLLTLFHAGIKRQTYF